MLLLIWNQFLLSVYAYYTHLVIFYFIFAWGIQIEYLAPQYDKLGFDLLKKHLIQMGYPPEIGMNIFVLHNVYFI